ncbi:nucleoprotein [Salmon aquaparamyxovirus]|uniref:Nucleocapsid n=2 Tax=Salmon aquaparamyxovirus TaxID=381543 RepID=B1NLR1_9MONO|nr:nucleoprotein [Salmon aquaparamyxovirus]ABW38048.1 nucleocapsid protein [Salmon aquaparamyxovirus]ABX57738.1 nucleoprotein [Salmon aquaparamyxovirus]
MAGIFESVKDLENHKIRLEAPRGGSRLLVGKKDSTPICIPNFDDQEGASAVAFMLRMLTICITSTVNMTVRGAALISAMLSNSEQPSVMMTNYALDQDKTYVQYFVTSMLSEFPFMEITNRGIKLENMMTWYGKMVTENDYDQLFPSSQNDACSLVSAELKNSGLNMVLGTLFIQIWICLTKAVTNPDVGEVAFNKRMTKLIQQKRVCPKLVMSQSALKAIREVLARQQNVRAFMVNFLIDLQGSGTTSSSTERMVIDIGTYISEAGMAGFMNTIEYGLKTRYPALATAELRPSLEKMESLITLYKSKGPLGPYMNILEDPDAVKFAPGAYPLLWSYAMGVAVATNKDMTGLVVERSFLSGRWFRAGQDIVRSQALRYNKDMIQQLSLDDSDIDELNMVINGEHSKTGEFIKAKGTHAGVEGEDDIEGEEGREVLRREESEFVDMPAGSSIRGYASGYGKEIDRASVGNSHPQAVFRFGDRSQHKTVSDPARRDQLKDILKRKLAEEMGEPVPENLDADASSDAMLLKGI